MSDPEVVTGAECQLKHILLELFELCVRFLIRNKNSLLIRARFLCISFRLRDLLLQRLIILQVFVLYKVIELRESRLICTRHNPGRPRGIRQRLLPKRNNFIAKVESVRSLDPPSLKHKNNHIEEPHQRQLVVQCSVDNECHHADSKVQRHRVEQEPGAFRFPHQILHFVLHVVIPLLFFQFLLSFDDARCILLFLGFNNLKLFAEVQDLNHVVETS